ncbi:MAG TPA: hypothetical protein HPP77_11750 [Candidatus Hydrogenedentes bacterium]|nr:hypothetical protein [Candidatus Hydrogenedentota bacterium]HIJ74509.1 hypothetical protein [Candidatus Hydrogenedentota bacterium]
MPVSTLVHITYCAKIISELEPTSVLDIGCGFGIWGFLSRYCLDIVPGRVNPDSWQVRVDGIEVFEPYIQPHHRALYNSIRIADVRDVADALDPYDLIIAGDVIEHLDKEEGHKVFERLYGKAVKGLLVNIPIGPGWEHPEAHGNPAELHRSQWEIADFDAYPSVCKEFELPCGKYASFLFKPNVPIHERVEWLQGRAHCYEAGGNGGRALECMRIAHGLDASDAKATLFLVDLLIKGQEWSEALQALEASLVAAPTFHYARLTMARLLKLRSRPQEAQACIETLLASDDVPPEIATDALALLEEVRKQ